MNFQFSGGSSSHHNTISGGTRRKAGPLTTLIIGILIMVIGVVAGVVSFSKGNHDSNIIKNGEQAQGTVIDVKEERSRSTNSSSISRSSSKKTRKEVIIVEYTVPQGSTFEVKETKNLKGKNKERTVLNSKVNVYYDVNEPSKGVVEGWENKSSSGLIFGGFFFLVGAVSAGSGVKRILSRN